MVQQKSPNRQCEFCGSDLHELRPGQLFCSNKGKCRRLASKYRKNPNPAKMAADIERMRNHPDRAVTLSDLQKDVRELKALVKQLIDSRSPLPTPPLEQRLPRVNGKAMSHAG